MLNFNSRGKFLFPLDVRLESFLAFNCGRQFHGGSALRNSNCGLLFVANGRGNNSMWVANRWQVYITTAFFFAIFPGQASKHSALRHYPSEPAFTFPTRLCCWVCLNSQLISISIIICRFRCGSSVLGKKNCQLVYILALAASRFLLSTLSLDIYVQMKTS